jgi:uncharacterized membrane protein YgcG
MNDKWEKVAKLDLNSVRQKYLFKKGWWWRIRRSATRIEAEYRQFLFLIVSNPGKTVVPWSRDLDDFWHQHILDTAKYATDCNAILGQFIHHNTNLPEGSTSHTKASAETFRMYKTAFGEVARKGRRRTSSDVGCGTDMPVVFCDNSTPAHQHHHSGSHSHHTHHDSGGGHHSGGHDSGGGHSGGHGCGGHGCGGHGGH